MNHKFEDTEGFEGECLVCCKSEAEHMFDTMDAMCQPPQIYRGMYIMPISCERESHIKDRQDASIVLEHIVMFGGKL